MISPLGKKLNYFILFLFLLPITISTATQIDSFSISSFGSIVRSEAIFVDFENDGSFQMGIATTPSRYRKYYNYSIIYEDSPEIWNTGGWAFDGNPTYAKFEPENIIVHSGVQSGRLEISDPTLLYHNNRLETLHRIDSRNHTESWLEAWYYIPFEVWDNATPGDGMPFHRISYTRLWSQQVQDQGGPYYQYTNILLSVCVDGRGATNGQKMFTLTVRGDVDDPPYDLVDDMGAMDYYSNGDGFGDGPRHEPVNQILVPFDRWFKVTTYIKRNIDTYLTDPEGGAIKVWIDNMLIWDIPRIRTVGVNPNVLEEMRELNGESTAYHGIGISAYGNNGGDASDPMFFYVDDVLMTIIP